MGKINVLVTGGAGYIGSNLCEKLNDSGKYNVFSIDNYFTGSEKNHHTGINYIKGHCKNIHELIDFHVDVVYHLGEYSRVEQSFEDREKVYDFNIKGMLSILEFCKKNKCKLIYAGSSTKFGDGGLGRNQSPYAWSKATNTQLLANYGAWFELKFAIVYFYNVYGKNELSVGKYATLMGIYKEKFMQGEPLPVVLPGDQKRNFTHINDIVEGLLIVGENGHGDDFGIGSDESFSVEEVAKMFDSKIIYLPERKGNRMTAEVITEKTKSLGWKCKNKLIDYIKIIKEKK